MLLPKKVKHRKWHKGRRRNLGVATRATTLSFGDYGLKTESHGWVSSQQIEAARRVLTRYVRRGGKVWIRIFPDKPLTKKAAETRMGSGKGNVEEWAAVIKPGRIIFEMDGIPQTEAFEALRLANNKLPIHCKPISKATEVLAVGRLEVARKAKIAKKAAAASAAVAKA